MRFCGVGDVFSYVDVSGIQRRVDVVNGISVHPHSGIWASHADAPETRVRATVDHPRT